MELRARNLLLPGLLVLGTLQAQAADPSVYNQGRGEFERAAIVDPTDNARFQIGCAAPGNSTAVPQVDARLAPGLEFISEFRFKEPSVGSIDYVYQDKIEAVSAPQSFSYFRDVLQADGWPGVNAGTHSHMQCVLEHGMLHCGSPSVRSGVHFPSCVMKSLPIEEEASVGTYKLARNGQEIPAFGYYWKGRGNWICDGKDLGPGVDEEVEIRTNSVPSRSATFCGGEKLFDVIRVTLDGSDYVFQDIRELLALSSDQVK